MNDKRIQLPAIEYFLQDAGDVIPTIDLGAERRNLVFMSIDEFAAKINEYGIDAFLNSNELSEASPYRDLLEASRAQVGLYDQYSAVLLSIVKQKTEDKTVHSKVAEKLELERMVYILGKYEAN